MQTGRTRNHLAYVVSNKSLDHVLMSRITEWASETLRHGFGHNGMCSLWWVDSQWNVSEAFYTVVTGEHWKELSSKR